MSLAPSSTTETSSSISARLPNTPLTPTRCTSSSGSTRSREESTTLSSERRRGASPALVASRVEVDGLRYQPHCLVAKCDVLRPESPGTYLSKRPPSSITDFAPAAHRSSTRPLTLSSLRQTPLDTPSRPSMSPATTFKTSSPTSLSRAFFQSCPPIRACTDRVRRPVTRTVSTTSTLISARSTVSFRTAPCQRR